MNCAIDADRTKSIIKKPATVTAKQVLIKYMVSVPYAQRDILTMLFGTCVKVLTPVELISISLEESVNAFLDW